MAPPLRMATDIPYEIVLLILDQAAVNQVTVAKLLRRVNRECARRYARQVWLLGARTHYHNYLRQLPVHPRRAAVRLLIPNGWGSVLLAAQVAANAAGDTVSNDSDLFFLLSKCTKFRI